LFFIACTCCTLLRAAHDMLKILKARSDAAPALSTAELQLDCLGNVLFRAFMQYGIVCCDKLLPRPA
jgi:hypothetical protein